VLLEVVEVVLDTLLDVEQVDLVEQVVVELVLKVIMVQQEQLILVVAVVAVEEYAV
jgi:hypothetical protein